MIKNKKYLILFVVLFGFLFVLSNKSSAAFKFEYNGEEYNYPNLETRKYNFVVDHNDRYGTEFDIYSFDDLVLYPEYENIKEDTICFYFKVLDRHHINTYGGLTTTHFPGPDSSALCFTSNPSVSQTHIFYSDFDIYYSTGELFFQSPVPKQTSTLRPILEQTNQEGTNLLEAMPKVMQEITTIIPLTLVVVVSCLGLRKALRMLSTLLHRCLIF